MDAPALTDRNFWQNYWQSMPNLYRKIGPSYVFGPKIKAFCRGLNIRSAIEIGGFPGYFAVYYKQYLNVPTPTLLDFYIDPSVVNRLLQMNGLDASALELIEGDFFKSARGRTFDLVTSFGFIEHFQDLREVLKGHVELMHAGSCLFITLPNFRGINGWVQKQFDPPNLAAHNLSSMDIALLERLCRELGLDQVKAYYTGGFGMWLDKLHQRPFWFRAAFYAALCVGKGTSKIIPVESRAFSPNIILTARKAR